MKFRILKYILFAFIWIATAQAQNSIPAPSVKLSSITTNYWTDLLKLNPLMATEYGVYDHNDEMEIYNFKTLFLKDYQMMNMCLN